MRVKVGDNWFDVTAEQPIMVELTEADRRNIGAMAPEATKYAAFASDDGRAVSTMLAWME